MTNTRMDSDGVFRRYDPNAIEEDDVEGRSIGTMNPVLARDLARATESDIQRATSRSNLINDTKRALRRKD